MLLTMVGYILAVLPVGLIYALLLAVGVSETVAYLIMVIPAAAILFTVAPWFFRWFWIGLTLQFRSLKSADAREKQLVAWTEAYEASQPAT